MRKIFAKSPPWYLTGLAFECQECGRCCAGPAEGYVWVTDEEIARIAEHLGMNEETFRKQHVRKVGRRQSLKEVSATKDCCFLAPRSETGAKGCSIYPVRPAQCRTWPFWPSNIDSPDSWAFAGTRCPGINRGKLFIAEEVARRARRTVE